MIEWRVVGRRGWTELPPEWLTGQNRGKGRTFRQFQIIYRPNEWIYSGTPRDKPWELFASAGGHPHVITYHATLEDAQSKAEEWQAPAC